MPNKIDIKRSSKSTGSILQLNAPNTQFVAINLEWNLNMLKIIRISLANKMLRPTPKQ
jgi:hypothetical protein